MYGVANRLKHLSIWSPVDGAVWAGYGFFIRCGVSGGNTSLGVGSESCRLVPFPVQPLCFLCADEDRAFSFLSWLPVAMFLSPRWTLPAGTVSQINYSISCHGHGILSQQQKLISVPPISLQRSSFTPIYPPLKMQIPPFQLHVFVFLGGGVSIKSSQCYSYMHGCEAIHWTKGNLSVPTSSKGIILLLLAVIHCQLLLSKGRGLETIYPICARILASLILCRSYTVQVSTAAGITRSGPEDTIPQHSSSSFGSYTLSSPSSTMFSEHQQL